MKKRVFSFVLILAITLAMLPTPAFAGGDVPYPVEGGNIYIYNCNNYYAAVGGADPGITAADIPDLITMDVWGLGNIQLYVRYIDEGAFADCTSLRSIKFSSPVQIAETAFTNCSSLEEIEFSGHDSMEGNPFKGTPWFENQSGFVTVGNYLLGYGGTPSGDIVIPDNVEVIAKEAFVDCTGITSVVIPETVDRIGNGAFSGCSNLRDITFYGQCDWGDDGGENTLGDPNAVVIHSYPGALIRDTAVQLGYQWEGIYETSGLCGINYDNYLTWTLDGDGVLTISGEGYMGFEFSGYDFYGEVLDREAVRRIIFENGVVGFYSEAFGGFVNLVSIEIPQSVEWIPGGMFADCPALSEILVAEDNPYYVSYQGILMDKDMRTIVCCPREYDFDFFEIPDTVQGIGEYAFAHCKDLTQITIPQRGLEILNNAFYESGLAEIEFLGNIWASGNPFRGTPWWENQDGFVVAESEYSWTLLGYSGIASGELVIPEGVNNITDYAFENCDKITSVTFPDSLNFVGEGAFWGCSSLTEVHEPASDHYINFINNPFKGTPWYENQDGFVVFHGKILGYNGTPQGELVIPGVRSVPMELFSNCDEITSVVFSKGTEFVEMRAFANCDGITSVVFQDEISIEGNYEWNEYGGAFDGCSNLKEVVFPANKDFRVGAGAFAGTPFWEEHMDEAGFVITDDNILIDYAGELPDGRLEIPKGVEKVATNFSDRQGDIISLVLPEGLIALGDGAFSGFSNLTSVTLPDSINSVGDYIFADCTNLKEITIPSGLTTITNSMFARSGLTEVVIPGNISKIEGRAFETDTLTDVTILNRDCEIADNWYSDDPDFVLNLETLGRRENVLIHGYSGSTAEAYAEKWGYRFEALPEEEHTHTYEAAVTAPTCTEKGYTTYTCQCGDSYVADYVDPLGHDYKEGVCVNCGEKDPSYVAGNPFQDVPEEKYFYTPVLWAKSQGIASGTDQAHFSPLQACTRAQVVLFLWRANGSPEPASEICPFTDVSESDYYYKAVLWALENGITSGISSTQFGSNDTVTREQFVTFLWKSEGSPKPATGENLFTDVTDPGRYSYDAILWAVENGITTGVDKTHFAPDQACTRAQVVTFLHQSDITGHIFV